MKLLARLVRWLYWRTRAFDHDPELMAALSGEPISPAEPTEREAERRHRAHKRHGTHSVFDNAAGVDFDLEPAKDRFFETVCEAIDRLCIEAARCAPHLHHRPTAAPPVAVLVAAHSVLAFQVGRMDALECLSGVDADLRREIFDEYHRAGRRFVLDSHEQGRRCSCKESRRLFCEVHGS